MTELALDPKELVEELGPAAEQPVGPCIGIATIALNMSMKYHDINTVQDGQLYQQYKLEGRNMHGLHIDMVFETAKQIEQHLVAANKRVSALLVASFAAMSDEDFEAIASETAQPENTDEPSP
jgi:hypothetical protein